jgi:hypothetical protein
MAVVKIPLTGSLVEELQTLLVRRDHTEQEDHSLLATFSVGLYCGLKMEIRSDEHPPPHFHVLYGNEDASFSIIDCQRLPRLRGSSDMSETFFIGGETIDASWRWSGTKAAQQTARWGRFQFLIGCRS